jgi:hypothetical protein
MRLDLDDKEAAALLRELNELIEEARYPFSARIQMLRRIRAKLPGAPPSPSPARPRRQRNASQGGHLVRGLDGARGEVSPGPPMTLGNPSAAHGYEPYFNHELVVAAAYPIALHLQGLEWHLIKSDTASFISSDRPAPKIIGYGFGIALSACLGLRLSKPTSAVNDQSIGATNASLTEIQAINQELRGREREWICSPGSWVRSL